MVSTEDLQRCAAHFRSSDPRWYDERFLPLLTEWSQQVTAAVILQTPDNPYSIFNAQGRAQQAQHVLRIFAEPRD